MMRKNHVLCKYISSLLLLLLFETVAIALWIAKDRSSSVTNARKSVLSKHCIRVSLKSISVRSKYERKLQSIR